VVDDHDLSRQYTVQALRQITKHVKEAGNARDALELAQRFRPQLIFLDLHLPDAHGLVLLRRIRQGWPAAFPLPEFVILSGDSSNGAQIRGGSPIARVMVKPVARRELRDLARKILPRTHAVEEQRADVQSRATTKALTGIFHEDLENQCRQLDESVSKQDWPSARAVLHRMTAASAICGEPEIERYCRLVTGALGDSQRPAELSRAYFGLLRAVERSRLSVQA